MRNRQPVRESCDTLPQRCVMEITFNHQRRRQAVRSPNCEFSSAWIRRRSGDGHFGQRRDVPSPRSVGHRYVVGYHQHRASGALRGGRAGDRVLDGKARRWRQVQQTPRPAGRHREQVCHEAPRRRIRWPKSSGAQCCSTHDQSVPAGCWSPAPSECLRRQVLPAVPVRPRTTAGRRRTARRCSRAASGRTRPSRRGPDRDPGRCRRCGWCPPRSRPPSTPALAESACRRARS